MSVYPRHAVDSGHVSDLARAIEAGNQVPLPIVEEKSRRIVDGVHRCRAWQKILGRGGEIEVEFRSYPDETTLLKDAIALNSAHARKLDAQDRTRCAILLEDHSVPITEIAVTLHTSESRVRELLVRVVVVKPKGSDRGERQPAKPITYPARGAPPREITPEQAQVMRSSGGLGVAQAAAQLRQELESGLADVSGSPVRERLWALHDAIETIVPRPESS